MCAYILVWLDDVAPIWDCIDAYCFNCCCYATVNWMALTYIFHIVGAVGVVVEKLVDVGISALLIREVHVSSLYIISQLIITWEKPRGVRSVESKLLSDSLPTSV